MEEIPGSPVTRRALNEWIDGCVAALHSRLAGHDDALLILEAFRNQYDLGVHRLLSDGNERLIQRIKTRLRRTLFPKRLKPLDDNDIRNLSAEQPDVLAWPWQPSHVEVMAPVVSALRSRGLRVPALSTNPGTHSCAVANIANTHCVTQEVDPTHYVNDTSCQQLLDDARGLPPLPTIKGQISFRQVLLDSLSLWYGLFTSTLAQATSVVDQIQPRSVLVGNDLTLVGRTACLVAERRPIPTFSIMHGLVDDESWKHSVCSKFFVFGDRDRDYLQSIGVEKDKLEVCGSPKLERAKATQDTITVGERQEHLKILIALSGPGHFVTLDHHLQIIEILTAVARQENDVLFMAKLHRKDRAEFYHHFETLPNTLVAPYQSKEYPNGIYAWVASVDGLVTASSMCALDAIAFNKPVITIDLVGSLSHLAFIREAATLHCSSKQEYLAAIQQIAADHWPSTATFLRAQKFRSRCFEQPRRGSAQAIAQRIATVLEPA